MSKDTFISVIVVVKNATRYIEGFIDSLAETLSAHYTDYEIVAVDDASEDRSVEALQAIQKRVRNIQFYTLSRAYGDSIATVAGLDNAIGDFVVIMNPETDTPETIPSMVQLAQQGYDVVYAVNTEKTRRGVYARLASAFYRTFQKLTGTEMPKESSHFRLMSRSVVNYITCVNDRHHLLKVLPAISGYIHTAIPYAARPAAKKRSIGEAIGRVMEGLGVLFASSVKPLRFATCTALFAGFLNLLYAIYVVVVALIKPDVAEGWVSLSLQSSCMFFLLSLVMTIISEYLYGIMERTQNRPLYHISRESSSMVFRRKEELNVVEKAG